MKAKKRFPIIIILFAVLFALAFLFRHELFALYKDAFGQKEKITADLSALSGSEDPSQLLQVHYIDVGQGDATLVTYKDHAMLIDAGDNSMGTTVQLYLEKHDVTHLDYVVETHPDADHIGGLDVILYKYDVDHVLMSAMENDTKSYQEVVDVLDEKGYKPDYPVAGDIFYMGDVKCTVLAPIAGKNYDETNNASVVLKLEYQDVSFLFAGDAEYEAMDDILEKAKSEKSEDVLKIDVYKVAHHGSTSSLHRDFLSKLAPEYAVVSCGKDNDYGHPHHEMIEYFEENKIEIYRTDLSGDIVAYSDGRKIAWETQ